MTTATETLTLFTEEPRAPVQTRVRAFAPGSWHKGLSKEQFRAEEQYMREYNTKRAEIAVSASECEIRGIPVRYEGHLIMQIGQAWKAVHVETVIWQQEARAA